MGCALSGLAPKVLIGKLSILGKDMLEYLYLRFLCEC